MARISFLLLIILFPLLSWSLYQLSPTGLDEETKLTLNKLDNQLFERQYSELQINELLRTVLNIKRVRNAQFYFDDKSQKYFLRIQFYEKVHSIQFQNTTDEMDSLISSFSVKQNDIYRPHEFKNELKKFKEQLGKLGYLNSKISAKIKKTQNNQLDITILLNSGPKTIINNINIFSSNLALSNSIETIVKGHAGQPYNDDILLKISDDIRTFFLDEGYYKSALSDPSVKFIDGNSKVNLSYRVINPNKYKITFIDNKAFNRKQLLEAINLGSISSSTPNLRPLIRQRLLKFYRNNGYNKANIEISAVRRSDTYVRTLTFKIIEGYKATIENINFQTSGSISATEIQDLWELAATEKINNDLFVESEISVSLENLVILLQNKGYIKAKVKRFTAESVKNYPYKINIELEIDEGPLTLIRSITFEDVGSFSHSQLSEVTELKASSPLDLDAVAQSLNKLELFYHSKGFLEMKISNRSKNIVTYSEDYTSADITYRIAEGPQIRVKNILIEGNELTQDFVILRELEFEKNDVLTDAEIQESIRRLQLLGHFSSIEISTIEKGTNIENRTVLVKVKEKEPGTFTLGAGVNNELRLTVRGFVGLSYRNIEGTGRSLSGRVQLNYNVVVPDYPIEVKITTGYLEPYLFNSRINGRISAERSQTINIADEEIADKNQLLFSLEQNITSNIIVRYELLNFASLRDRSIYINAEDATDTKVNIATTGPVFDIDFRNHPFNPTRGTFSQFRFEYGHPDIGSSDTIEFTRATARFSHYIPLSDSERWIYINTLKAGSLQNLSDHPEGGVPYDKKGFLIGGLSTLRGYDPIERFPNEIDLGSSDYLITDWSQFALLRSEIQFPLYGSWKGSLFYDGGFVDISNVEFQDFYRDSLGFGVLYETPVGPFKLELGKKLDPQTRGSLKEKDIVFHISIGNI